MLLILFCCRLWYRAGKYQDRAGSTISSIEAVLFLIEHEVYWNIILGIYCQVDDSIKLKSMEKVFLCSRQKNIFHIICIHMYVCGLCAYVHVLSYYFAML